MLSDPQVESVFINVYGGITSCEQVAKGILQAFDELGTHRSRSWSASMAMPQPRACKSSPRRTTANLHVEGTMEQAAAEAARLAANEASKEAKQ